MTTHPTKTVAKMMSGWHLMNYAITFHTPIFVSDSVHDSHC
jgi:hypothetical protein